MKVIDYFRKKYETHAYQEGARTIFAEPDPYKGSHYMFELAGMKCSDPPCGGQALPPVHLAKIPRTPLRKTAFPAHCSMI